jgi:O-methyltransferase
MTTSKLAADLTAAERNEPARVFDAALPFPHQPPFDIFFAERIPLLHAFGCAITKFRLDQLKGENFLQRIARAIGISTEVKFIAAECGVYTGSSLIACANLARDAGANFHFIGLDTFEGLPPLSETDLIHAPRKARYKSRQLFSDTSIEQLNKMVQAYKLMDHVTLRKGLFAETLHTLAERKYNWVNIDCDLYEPHLECLRYFYPRMAAGGTVFFDDYHSIDFPMARVAIDEFMADKSEQLVHVRYGGEGPNRLKAFFVKA